MRKLMLSMVLIGLTFAMVDTAEAGRRHRGGKFWGGFAAGALTGALLGPPVVVGPPPVVVAPVRRVYRPRRVWVPGEYVVQYQSCGTPYRVWRPGYYRRGY